MNATAKIILDALEDVTVDALVTNQHAQQIAAELADALEARGFAIRKKPAPRKPAAPVKHLVSQGDAALDEFIRTHHSSDWEARMKKATSRTRPGMMSMPSPAPGHGSKALTQTELATLYADHKVIQYSA